MYYFSLQLLEEDPALKKFKSYKNTVKRVSRIGDVLTILVVAGKTYANQPALLLRIPTVRNYQFENGLIYKLLLVLPCFSLQL